MVLSSRQGEPMRVDGLYGQVLMNAAYNYVDSRRLASGSRIAWWVLTDGSGWLGGQAKAAFIATNANLYDSPGNFAASQRLSEQELPPDRSLLLWEPASR
jgi:hypothetical protein